MKRYPAVAGTFYEYEPEKLKEQIKWAFTHKLGPGELPKPSKERKKITLGVIVPHAGYMYSGPIAAHSYYRLAEEGVPETVILIGPNHTGFGTAVSIMTKGSWITPLGEVEIDEEFADAIVKRSSIAAPDERAHAYEHSLEVQLPFLQFIYESKFKIVPITLMLQTPEVAKDLAKSIHEVWNTLERDIIVIATTDFTHYEPHSIATRKDKLAIEKIVNLDSEGLYKVVEEYNISMCGPGAAMTLIELAKLRDAKNVVLLAYATSGDITRDKSAVVGYASIQFRYY